MNEKYFITNYDENDKFHKRATDYMRYEYLLMLTENFHYINFLSALIKSWRNTKQMSTVFVCNISANKVTMSYAKNPHFF